MSSKKVWAVTSRRVIWRMTGRSLFYGSRRRPTAVLSSSIARRWRKTAEFTAGKISGDDFQDNLDTVAEVAQSHRDAILRHRRAMLDLNTAVGLRLLP